MRGVELGADDGGAQRDGMRRLDLPISLVRP